MKSVCRRLRLPLRNTGSFTFTKIEDAAAGRLIVGPRNSLTQLAWARQADRTFYGARAWDKSSPKVYLSGKGRRNRISVSMQPAIRLARAHKLPAFPVAGWYPLFAADLFGLRRSSVPNLAGAGTLELAKWDNSFATTS